ncbi:Icarapin-like protein, partial [Ooceraea biroi]
FFLLSETMTRLRNNLMSYFWNLPDITNMKIPEGANTTSTVKIIDGHVVTINETTYSSGDANSNTAFRIRIIDVKPQNETVPAIGGGGNAEPTTVRAEAPESAESVEDFNNEIPKNADTLTA